MKSGPTSGPLTVSSAVIHVFQGVAPPAQFICVPLQLTQDSTLAAWRLTSSVIVPPPAILSYAFSDWPKAPMGPLTSWLRTSR